MWTLVSCLSIICVLQIVTSSPVPAEITIRNVESPSEQLLLGRAAKIVKHFTPSKKFSGSAHKLHRTARQFDADQQNQQQQSSQSSSSSSSSSSSEVQSRGGSDSMSGDNGASILAADGITMDKLYGQIDINSLAQPYGKPENTVMDMPPVVLPPQNEVREGDNRNYLQIYPDEYKQQQVVSNKLINTYSQQNKNIDVNNQNTINFLKNVHVNTEYVTNVQRINHPKVQINTVVHTQNRYVPKLVVQHTRTDRVNDLPPQEVPQVVESGSSTELPPIIDQPQVENQGYNQVPPPLGRPAPPPQEQKTEIVSTEVEQETLAPPPPPTSTQAPPPPPPPPQQPFRPFRQQPPPQVQPPQQDYTPAPPHQAPDQPHKGIGFFAFH